MMLSCTFIEFWNHWQKLIITLLFQHVKSKTKHSKEPVYKVHHPLVKFVLVHCVACEIIGRLSNDDDDDDDDDGDGDEDEDDDDDDDDEDDDDDDDADDPK